jgi:hypothetical protein
MSKYAESATINPVEFERFGSPRSLNSNSIEFDGIRAVRVPSRLQAGGLEAAQTGGLQAISRWLSEVRATPPVPSGETQCIPKGCQF